MTRANQRAAEAGVGDLVEFQVLDASTGLPETFDVIFTFDVIHDATDPQRLLSSIHDALRPHGRYVCLDINCSHRLEDNVGPLGAFFYGVSTLYCMTTSLANGGAGLGTAGLPPGKLDELAAPPAFARSAKPTSTTPSTTSTSSRLEARSGRSRAVRGKSGIVEL